MSQHIEWLDAGSADVEVATGVGVNSETALFLADGDGVAITGTKRQVRLLLLNALTAVDEEWPADQSVLRRVRR